MASPTTFEEIAVTLDYSPIQITVGQPVTQVVSVAEQGPMGPAGGTTTTIINIVEPQTTWTLSHFLGKYPSLTIIDTSGAVVIASYTYLNSNTIEVDFSAPTSGTAYLN
jgi:hypothetical protein